MKKIIISFLLLSICTSWSIAQKLNDSGEAIVGQPCPDLYFQKTINFNKPSFYLHELRGKWVILDLWSMNCGGCIASFPHISEKQAKFKDKVQFLMGTYDDPEGKHTAIYTRFKNELHLQMPCVFKGTSETEPTDLFKQLKVGALPFVVIIDPVGVVKAVTVTVNEEQIQQLINGETPKFADAFYSDDRNEVSKELYNRDVPFLVDGNGGSGSRDEFEYRSLLAKWTPKIDKNSTMYFIPERKVTDKIYPPGRLEGRGLPLINLYYMAYFGNFNKYSAGLNSQQDSSKFLWPEAILEMKDTSNFISDEVLGENLFCYSLLVPPTEGTKQNMMEIMQSDLKHYFKYDVRWEMRQMPCWKLIISDANLARQLKTKGGKFEGSSQPIPWVSYKGSNVSMDMFRKWLQRSAGLDDKPFLDETGIDYNVDFYFEAVKNNIESFNNALQKLGLKIVKSEMKMKTLVIRDPAPIPTNSIALQE